MLPPASAEAQRLQQTVQVKERELRPSYVADVKVTKDGDGFHVEFSLKTHDGKLTAAEGQARVRLVLAAKQRHATVVQRLFDSSYDVPLDAFGRITRAALGVRTPRIARSDVAQFGMSEIGSRGFARLLIEHDLVLLMTVDYTPTGGERVTFTDEFSPLAF